MAEENPQSETPSQNVNNTETDSSTGSKDTEEKITAKITEGSLPPSDTGLAKGAASDALPKSETADADQADKADRMVVSERSSTEQDSDTTSRGIELHKYRRPFNEKTARYLNYAGIIFILISGVILITLSYRLYQISSSPVASSQPFNDAAEVMAFYLRFFSAPLLLLVTSLITSGIGYGLLRAAGTATKQVVNPEDMDLVALLLANNKQTFLDDYVRLSSLTGFTGMFTKVGLYGLPLATIALTIIFTVLAMLLQGNPPQQQSLFDLAKLTLGAFIGSFVQRQAVENQGHDIRKQVADVQNKMLDVQSKITDVQKKV